MRIEIDSRQLRAALCCAGKADIRYCLNGLALEVHADRVLILATDGHRLYIGRSSNKPEVFPGATDDALTYIIPRDLVESALRALPKKGQTFSAYVDLPDVQPGEVKISVLGAGFTGQLIDGKFPDWRRIVSAGRQSREAGQFKPEYIADCQKIADIFAWGPRSQAYIDVAHNGTDGVALVTFSTTGDACVFQMPLRTFEARNVHDWLKQETGSLWDKEVGQ